MTKILVVDDDPVVRLLMQECLTGHGFEVTSLADGSACLETLRRSLQPQPDLVMVDLLMPGMSGIEVLKELKGTPEFAHIPVIVLSAHTDTARICGDSGLRPDGVLEKPFSLAAVLGLVRELTPAARPGEQ